jgi:hypothetical protein
VDNNNPLGTAVAWLNDCQQHKSNPLRIYGVHPPVWHVLDHRSNSGNKQNQHGIYSHRNWNLWSSIYLVDRGVPYHWNPQTHPPNNNYRPGTWFGNRHLEVPMTPFQDTRQNIFYNRLILDLLLGDMYQRHI